MSIRSIYERITRWFLLDFASKVHWRLRGGLTDEDRAQLKELLAKDYYVIVTRRRNHLTTYLTAIGNFILSGKFSYWGHVLMNLEDKVNDVSDFRLVEAITPGVEYTPFDKVFDCSAVALLKPKGGAQGYWTMAMDASKTYVGRPYDTLFDLAHDNKMSCVEVVLDAIRAIPNHMTWFSEFENDIAKRKNLTPQMFYDCSDFEVVWEVRK
jgi:signal peptidase I